MDKYHGIAATVGGLIAAAAVAVLSANKVDVAAHWLEIVGGIGGLVAVGSAAAVAVLRKRNP